MDQKTVFNPANTDNTHDWAFYDALSVTYQVV